MPGHNGEKFLVALLRTIERLACNRQVSLARLALVLLVLVVVVLAFSPLSWVLLRG